MKAYRQNEVIAQKLGQLEKMRAYLAYSTKRMRDNGVAGRIAHGLADEEAEILAAFRTRFSEYQEHTGKLINSIAIEEEIKDTSAFSNVLAFAEKVGIIASESDWKEPRDVRNAISHEYEENAPELAELVREMVGFVEPLMKVHDNAIRYCKDHWVSGCRSCSHQERHIIANHGASRANGASTSSVEHTQFIFGLLKNAFLVCAQIQACAVDVERQHGYGGAEGGGLWS